MQRAVTRLPLLAVIPLLASKPLFAEPLGFPPLSDATPPEHLQGKIVWADLVTPNLAGAQAFYTGLFGWVMHDINFGSTDYAVASVDGRPIAGLLQSTETAVDRPCWPDPTAPYSPYSHRRAVIPPTFSLRPGSGSGARC